jgi:endonuclease/exonuclease/phosphatase family metal-dependent hydrolase
LGGGDRIEKQVKALCSRKPDIIALQEVTPETAVVFEQLFANTKLKHTVNSFPQRNSNQLKGGRQFGELIASHWELEQIPSTKFGAPWSEKVLSANVDTPQGVIEIHTVHVPHGSGHGWTKIEMFEAIYKTLACNVEYHRILCGDFNSPQEETADGRIITWGQETKRLDGRYIIREEYRDEQGRVFPEDRWDLGERNVLEGLRRYDLSDVFRSKHGYRKKAFSYYGRGQRRRYDHIFASSSLKIIACEYLQRFRQLSDHFPMEAAFKIK